MRVSPSMKKSDTKLSFRSSTVRLLQPDALAAVHGGDRGNTRAPTNFPTNCSGSRDCNPHNPHN